MDQAIASAAVASSVHRSREVVIVGFFANLFSALLALAFMARGGPLNPWALSTYLAWADWGILELIAWVLIVAFEDLNDLVPRRLPPDSGRGGSSQA